MKIEKVKNPLLNAPAFKRVLSPEQKAFRDEIAEWLNIYPWVKVWTVTFDRMEERRQQNYTGRAGFVPGHGWTGGNHYKGKPEKVGISERNAKRYFEAWMKKHYPDYSWFYCVEPNPSRDGHHLHALIMPPLGVKCSHAQMGKAWWDRYGWNKVEDIRSPEDVTGYCTKHVVRYLNKGAGWYNIEINCSEIYHGKHRREKTERVLH
jgi:hypothetical protein